MTTLANTGAKMQDNQIEDETLEQLLVIEKEFREHNALMENEMHLQKELAARLWTVSQRYILLEGIEMPSNPLNSQTQRIHLRTVPVHTGTSSRCPQIYTISAEDALLKEFTDKLEEIQNSNCRLSSSLDELRKSCLIFDKLCSQLHMSNETPLIIGDAFHKPISYFIELVSDLFKYFHAWLLKLKFSSHQFDPLKIESIENYKKQLQISEEFEEYLNVGLAYCKCLQPKTKC